MQFGNGSKLNLEALVSSGLAVCLEETPLAEDQRLVMKGERARLSATVLDTWQLNWWILSRGPDIEVLKPAKLRKQIALALREAATQYDGQKQ